MLQLAEVLSKVGFDTEGRRETFDSLFNTLSQSSCPCIVHLVAPDHFVVVCAIERDRVHLFDGSGIRTAWPRGIFYGKWGREVLWVRRRAGTESLPVPLPGNHDVAPAIQFERLMVDKGSVPATGRPVPFVYPFRNVGNADLLIADVRVGCKCLDAKAPKERIRPGERGAIELLYHLQPRSGPFCYNAAVMTNDPRIPTVLLHAAGFTGTELNIQLWICLVPGYLPSENFARVSGRQALPHHWHRARRRAPELSIP